MAAKNYLPPISITLSTLTPKIIRNNCELQYVNASMLFQNPDIAHSQKYLFPCINILCKV